MREENFTRRRAGVSIETELNTTKKCFTTQLDEGRLGWQTPSKMLTHDTARIVIGQSTSDHVIIERVSSPNNEKWFHASVSVQSAVWGGKLRAEFMAGELRRFGLEIERLYKELNGRAELRPIEPFLEMTFEGDGRGHILVSGTACDRLGTGTRLVFEFELDQTQLPSIARALNQADSEVR